jgi:hypothetical protein
MIRPRDIKITDRASLAVLADCLDEAGREREAYFVRLLLKLRKWPNNHGRTDLWEWYGAFSYGGRLGSSLSQSSRCHDELPGINAQAMPLKHNGVAGPYGRNHWRSFPSLRKAVWAAIKRHNFIIPHLERQLHDVEKEGWYDDNSRKT